MINPISIILLEESWWSGLGPIWTVLGILVMVALALIVFLSKRREEVQITETKRADANMNLVKTRDVEIIDLTKTISERDEMVEQLTSENRTVTAIKIAELIDHWMQYESVEAERIKEKRELATYRRMFGPLEAKHDENHS